MLAANLTRAHAHIYHQTYLCVPSRWFTQQHVRAVRLAMEVSCHWQYIMASGFQPPAVPGGCGFAAENLRLVRLWVVCYCGGEPAGWLLGTNVSIVRDHDWCHTLLQFRIY